MDSKSSNEEKKVKVKVVERIVDLTTGETKNVEHGNLTLEELKNMENLGLTNKTYIRTEQELKAKEEYEKMKSEDFLKTEEGKQKLEEDKKEVEKSIEYNTTHTEEEKEEILNNKNKQILITKEQKIEMYETMMEYIENRFDKEFSELILTDNVAGYVNDCPLQKCHYFLKCLNTKNINWEKSTFKYNMYGMFNIFIFMNDDYIEFINVDDKTVSFRFSFDKNVHTLAYPEINKNAKKLTYDEIHELNNEELDEYINSLKNNGWSEEKEMATRLRNGRLLKLKNEIKNVI